MIVDQKNSVVLKQFKNAKKINRDKIASVSLLKNKNLVLDLNRNQMRLGINAIGNLFSQYSIPYWEFKRTLPTYKAPDGIADLYLRGHFQTNMNLTVSNDSYDIDSNVPYADRLKRRYNPFGLSGKYHDAAETKITVDYNSLFHKELNK